MGFDVDSAEPSGAPGVLGLLAEPLRPELVRGLLRTVIDPRLVTRLSGARVTGSSAARRLVFIV